MASFGVKLDDPLGLIGQTLCGDLKPILNAKFKSLFAYSNRYIYSFCPTEGTACKEILCKVYDSKSSEDAKREGDFMERASKLGVSPKFLGIRTCSYCCESKEFKVCDTKKNDEKTYTFLLMEKYGKGTLTELYKKNYFFDSKQFKEEDVKCKLKEILNILYTDGIDHNDLHSDNFLFDIKNNELEFKIIDFDNAVKCKSMIELDNAQISIVGTRNKKVIDLSKTPITVPNPKNNPKCTISGGGSKKITRKKLKKMNKQIKKKSKKQKNHQKNKQVKNKSNKSILLNKINL